MDAYPITSLPEETYVVFVASTAGQGEVPPAMLASWRFLLQKHLPPTSLGRVRVAVFGLGDSGYAMYNVAAKKLYRRLLQLGAAELCPLGLGDDRAALGYEGALGPWLTRLWAALRPYTLPATMRAAGPSSGAISCLLL